ncbi:GtrA family protein [Terrabacter sp. NPDC080008]|uniref:GtrA family protein n=1 Tax=Terrabacter sp. NPDC080008 TaxID=3155176 RepID=UPI00344EC8C2
MPSSTPAPTVGRLSQQLVRFAGVGVLSTALHLGLFAAVVRGGAPSQLANGVALVIATVVNTALNRAWTFGVTGRRRLVAHHGQALVVFAITYAATTVALAVLGALVPGAGTLAQTCVVAVANVLSTALRFVAMRRWIFRTPASGGPTAAAPGGPTDRHEPAYAIEGVLESPEGDG